VETIAIYRLGSIGDTVAALPCFHRIARSFPNSRRVLLTSSQDPAKATPVVSVLGPSGLIDDAIVYRTGERRMSALMRVRSELRSLGVKTLIYLIQPRGRRKLLRDLTFFKLCGVRHIIGASGSSDLLYPRIDPVTGWVEREAERLARGLSELGPLDLMNPDAWDLKLTQDEMDRARLELLPLGGHKFAAVNLGGKTAKQDWGDSNWTALLKRMKSVFDLALVFVGAAHERKRTENLAGLWPGPSINLCGSLSPRESAAAMKFAKFYLGHDSGPMHLAASVGIPCVAVFGDHDPPKQWHPLGSQHRIIHNMAGISAIRPQEVFEAICSLPKHQ